MAREYVNTSTVFAGLWTAAWHYRYRTLSALGLLVLAKIAAVLVPLVLKAIVDEFSQPGGLQATVSPEARGPLRGIATILVLPVFLLLGYALLRLPAPCSPSCATWCSPA